MQGPGSCYSAYCVGIRAIFLTIFIISLFSNFCVRRVINVLRILQFVRESVFTEKTVEMAEVATGFKVRPYFGDFNAVFTLMERYRKKTRISLISGRLLLDKGCVKAIGNVPTLLIITRGCVRDIGIVPSVSMVSDL